MILAILQHTPTWVWMAFIAVMTLGISQTRTREVSQGRATLLPLVMTILSLSGVLSAFSQVPLALAAWGVGLVLSFTVIGPVVAIKGATWLPEMRRFRIPGSWLPITLILGLFATKYSAGVSLALNHSLATDIPVATLLSLTYGVFAGIFLARARSLFALTRIARGVQVA